MKLVTKKPVTVAVMRHAGSHLILPLVGELAHKTVNAPKGDASLLSKPADKVIVFLRDPRNWMISVFKWKRVGRMKPPGAVEGYIDDQLAQFMVLPGKRKSMSYMMFVQLWAGRWIDWPGSLTVRFEDLQDREKGIQEAIRIRDYLGDLCLDPDPNRAYDAVFGKSQTYTGRPSNWLDWFGPATQDAWKRHGGAELLQRMGYD